MDSPILGGDGNQEFLIVLAHSAQISEPPRLWARAATGLGAQREIGEKHEEQPPAENEETQLVQLPPARPKRKQTAHSRALAHARRKEQQADTRGTKL